VGSNLNIVRKVFRTRVPIACAALTALLGLPAAPADAVVIFAGTCATTAHMEGPRLVLDGTCIYAPSVTGSLHAWGDLAPILPLPLCGMGVYQSDPFSVSTTVFGMGPLQVVNSGTLELSFVSHNAQMIFAGELVPSGLSGTCPSQWTGVLVIEDPALEG
jgi:hypothetical protein